MFDNYTVNYTLLGIVVAAVIVGYVLHMAKLKATPKIKAAFTSTKTELKTELEMVKKSVEELKVSHASIKAHLASQSIEKKDAVHPVQNVAPPEQHVVPSDK